MANLIRGLSENGGVVFCGVDSTELVRRAEQLHTTSATCSAALGRLLTGASLMGSMLKDDGDKVTLRVQGGGPAGVLIACTDGTGNVKGCIDNPLVELPPKADGHLDVGGAVGRSGVLTVIRDNRLQKEPTVGQVPLVSGEIAEDLTRYYATSEQIPTVCALGVLVDKDLSILCAGGYLLQLLPGATDAEIDTLEKNIAAMPSVTEMLRAGKTPKDMMELAMAGFAPQVLDERTVGYQCDCSEERTKGMLLSLGRAELVRMRDEAPHCEVVCHFCHSRYQYDLNDLIAEYDAQAAQRAAEEAAQNTNA
jgi:molecular chaperone Hsp33